MAFQRKGPGEARLREGQVRSRPRRRPSEQADRPALAGSHAQRHFAWTRTASNDWSPGWTPTPKARAISVPSRNSSSSPSKTATATCWKTELRRQGAAGIRRLRSSERLRLLSLSHASRRNSTPGGSGKRSPRSLPMVFYPSAIGKACGLSAATRSLMPNLLASCTLWPDASTCPRGKGWTSPPQESTLLSAIRGPDRNTVHSGHGRTET